MISRRRNIFHEKSTESIFSMLKAITQTGPARLNESMARERLKINNLDAYGNSI